MKDEIKEAWGPGPWQHEPDELDWRDDRTGLNCMIRRGYGGQWNGYVAVPPGHPLFGKSRNEVNIYAHGGLTFSDGATLDGEWMFGFECGHIAAGDLVPIFTQDEDLSAIMSDRRCTYRDFDFVRKECADLARQLASYGGRR